MNTFKPFIVISGCLGNKTASTNALRTEYIKHDLDELGLYCTPTLGVEEVNYLN